MKNIKQSFILRRIYIDTSVVGGYFDKEFSESTVHFFERALHGEHIILVSDLLEEELKKVPLFVKELLKTLPASTIEQVQLTTEAKILASKYVEAKIVGQTTLSDCQHIAIATLYKADVLLSWNFKHIVNLDRIKGYNGINSLLGYSPIEIRTPKEIMNYDDN